jgi:hypothetical protein
MNKPFKRNTASRYDNAPEYTKPHSTPKGKANSQIGVRVSQSDRSDSKIRICAFDLTGSQAVLPSDLAGPAGFPRSSNALPLGASACGQIPKNVPLARFLDGISPHRFEPFATNNATKNRPKAALHS